MIRTRRSVPAAPASLAVAALAAAVLAAGPVPAARAQDALGAGNALDNSLDTRTGGVNASRGTENFRARNLLITNNVAGGRGFRGTVGYGAENDFRSNLGSNDLFQFRSDSAWSNVSVVNLGQTFQRMRYGQELALLEYDRSGAAVTSGDVRRPPRPRDLVFDTQLRLDRVTYNSGFVSDFERDAVPLTVGSIRSEESGTAVVRASSLGGVVATPVESDAMRFGVSGMDLVRFRQDRERGLAVRPIGTPFDGGYGELEQILARGLDGGATPGDAETSLRDGGRDDGRADERIGGREDGRIGGRGEGRDRSRVESAIAQNRSGTTSQPDFLRIQERVALRYAGGPAEAATIGRDRLAGLDAELDALRRRLSGIPEAGTDEERGRTTPTVPGRGEEAEPGDERSPLDPFGITRDEDDEDDGVAIERMGRILRHGERIERLTPGGGSRFAELIESAEVRLREGEYFWAERYFNRALRFTPGHPLATAGLAHSQLGAGLYLSSSLTLRSLFTQQPEMIDARYDEGLVPNRPRMLSAVSDLRKRIGEERDLEANGFLLAYIGHLLEDRGLVRQGLDAMRAAESTDPLLPLLDEIWTADD